MFSDGRKIIKPAEFSNFRHRRVCETAFLVAICTIILFLLGKFTDFPILSDWSRVPIGVIIIAGITILTSIISYLKPPKKYTFALSLTLYYLSGCYVAWLIMSSGIESSPFIVLWTIVGLFSGAFGILFGWLPFLIISGVLFALQYIGAYPSTNVISIAIVAQVIPLLISPLIWRETSKKDASESHSIQHLSNELSQVSSKSEVIINAIGDGVIFVDSQELIRLINPAAQAILGWSKQDAISLNYKSVLRLTDDKDEVLGEVSDPVYQVLNNNQQIRASKLSLITRNDKKLIISLVVSPVGEAGSGVIVVFRDITKEATEEREQAEFVSTASHEMRTPVASIEGYLGLALNPQTAQIDIRARDFITKAHESAQHLGRLFQDLLDVSKSEDGRMTSNPQPINIVKFINSILESFRPKIEAKGLSIDYLPMPDNKGDRVIAPDYIVNLDNDHLREIIDNLVDNAVKYTPSGNITINVTGDDEHVTVSVKDTGIGIPAEDIPHLFQKFYRIENKDTNAIGGTGLGLYLSRRLVESMGGRIWVESVRGEGSTFYVELPRVSEQEAATLLEQAQIRQSQQTIIQNVTTTATTQPAEQPTIAPDFKPETITQSETHNVPRGEALTPEQIAAYATKQHELAAQESQGQSISEGNNH